MGSGEQAPKQGCKKKLWLFVAASIFLFALALTLGLVLKKDSTSVQIAPTRAPTVAQLPSLHPTVLVQGGLDVELPPSGPNASDIPIPQSCSDWAQDWVVNNTPNHGQLPEWRKRQRFVMALLYCEWEGNNWTPGASNLPSFDAYANDYRNECHFDILSNLTTSKFDTWIPYFSSGPCNILGRNENGLYTVRMEKDVVQNVPEKAIKFFASPNPNSQGQQPWLSQAHECDWLAMPNVELCTLDGKVRTIRLPNMNLSGTVPTEIGLLDLREFSVPYNPKLKGTVPSELGRLGRMFLMDVTHTALEGPIEDLLQHPDMAFLYLENSRIRGTIPDTIASTTFNLQILLAGETEIGGSLPQSMAMVDWRRLHLQGNGMFGTIPPGLISSSKLEELWLQQNSFEGDVSEWFGTDLSVRHAVLRDLRLSSNDFVGNLDSVCPLFSTALLQRAEVDQQLVICSCCTVGST